MYIYIYVYVCVYVCIHARVCVCVCVCAFHSAKALNAILCPAEIVGNLILSVRNECAMPKLIQINFSVVICRTFSNESWNLHLYIFPKSH